MKEKNAKKEDFVQKGRKLEQISFEIYNFNNKTKNLEKEIINIINEMQAFKNKYSNQRQISMRMQFLINTMNNLLKFLKQNKINQNMIDINNL